MITEVSKKEKKNYAPELYDLTTLQKEASKRYGFSPKQTLNIMQSLYEHHKVLTYPRQDQSVSEWIIQKGSSGIIKKRD